jgi:hypothetical protein
MKGLEALHNDASESVVKSLGINPEEIASRSTADAGNDTAKRVAKEIEDKYGPLAEAMEKRNAEAVNISLSDDARLNEYGKMIERGMTEVGTDSPLYKHYTDWGNRLLAKENVGGLDMLKTELNGEIQKAIRAGDVNTIHALKNIRNGFADFQENQIAKQAIGLEKNGVKGAGKMGEELINQRMETNRNYAEFA